MLELSEKADDWNESHILEFTKEVRKQSKPIIIAANKVDTLEGKKNFEKLKEKFPETLIIPCSADFELALREASNAGLVDYLPGNSDFEIKGDVNEKQKKALESIKRVLKEFGSTGVQDVLNNSVFDLLKYIAIFPAGAKLADSKGNILPDCFLMPENSTALDFAYHLHTDIGDGFIKAIDVRTKKAVGKEHVLKHRDGVEIITR